MEEDGSDVDVPGKIRDDLMEGDYRTLYLPWAKFATDETDEEDQDKDRI